MCLLHMGHQEPIYPQDSPATAAVRVADNARRKAFRTALEQGVRDMPTLTKLAGDWESAYLALKHWDADMAPHIPTSPRCAACGVDIRFHTGCNGADTPFIR